MKLVSSQRLRQTASSSESLSPLSLSLLQLALFFCLLQLALCQELLYTPSYSYYAAPLAYARTAFLAAPLHAQSHVYHSVQTPSSFQQQYRSDIKPLTYEYVY